MPAREVELPNGEKAFFRDKPKGRGVKKLNAAAISAATLLVDYPELLEGPREGESEDARAERLAVLKMQLSPRQSEFLGNLQEATVIALMESWTINAPLPRSEEDLWELDGDVYTALLEAVLVGEGQATDFSPIPIKADDPSAKESPTTGSSSSDGPSEDLLENHSTTTPTSDGSPTSGESSSLEQ